MSASPVVSEQRLLIFDTGPLWELVVYSAVHVLGFETLKQELRHVSTEPDYKRLTDFIASFPKKTTTPHVIGEISAWIIRKTQPKGYSAIWRLIYREFSSMGMDEDVLKLLGMPQELVAEFGVVDAGILRLASSLRRIKPLVLSVDSALISECKRAGVNAKDLWEVIS
jgi:hypothetical protein